MEKLDKKNIRTQLNKRQETIIVCATNLYVACLLRNVALFRPAQNILDWLLVNHDSHLCVATDNARSQDFYFDRFVGVISKALKAIQPPNCHNQSTYGHNLCSSHCYSLWSQDKQHQHHHNIRCNGNNNRHYTS